uniref:Uncharacterized protein n=3 Tax=Oryza TaxID=4527 RepID=Q7G3T3_ORYSJ|nr:Hypothetical protein [Oryza sativa Japonica Group]AAP53033.1 hypothetical protein LOC_Os10g18460 [Oryza sativa Japonica Group]
MAASAVLAASSFLLALVLWIWRALPLESQSWRGSVRRHQRHQRCAAGGAAAGSPTGGGATARRDVLVHSCS